MSLNLFYITNRLDVALAAEKNGVDRIWIDLETKGKAQRQPGNTVKSNHSIEDIKTIAPHLTTAEMLVRINPWDEDSVDEIEAVIEAGAEIIMLPMWKSAEEVEAFIKAVDGRVKTTLLLETKEGVACIDKVLELDFDEIHIGLNDLHLSYGMNFMFEPLTNGLVEALCKKFAQKGIPYGFGGIARVGGGIVDSRKIIMEHYRLGSTRAILSRSFCDINTLSNIEDIENLFETNMKTLREYEHICQSLDESAYRSNQAELIKLVDQVVRVIQEERRREDNIQ